MTPKPRKPENRKLPARWRHKHGAFYYRVPAGQEALWDDKQEFRLGHTLAEAYQTWALRVDSVENIRCMGDLLDRYNHETVPTKAPKTQESNRISIRRLRPVFSHMPLICIKPKHAYRYLDEVTKKHGAASANRDLEVLSHSLSKAVEWGLIDRNPIKGQVRKNSIKRRERYIEDWEITEALKVANPTLQAYIILKLLTGLRRGDMLRIRTSDLKLDGIHVQTSKTGKKLIIEWTDELEIAINTALSARPKDIAPWVFCTRQGKCYVKEDGSANAFDSLWQRFMFKVIASTKVKNRFQEKDLRKKTASDMELNLASKLLGHTKIETTARHYRLTGEKVSPHTLKKPSQ